MKAMPSTLIARTLAAATLLRWLPVLLLPVLFTDCRQPSPSAVVHDSALLREWLEHDPDSCLWYCTDLYTPLYHEHRYDSLEHIYARLLRAVPPHLRETKNAAYLLGYVLTFYHNALMLQDKTLNSHHLTDSLLRSGHPYYTRTLRPELLAITARFYLAQDSMSRVDSIGRLFLTLPSTGDLRRDARAWHQMAWCMEAADISTRVPQLLMERATAACRQVDGKVGNEGEIYGYMGYLYWKNGRWPEAVTAIQEAIDWYNARPGTPGDGLLDAYNDLSRVYADLCLYDRALDANAHAIRCAQGLDNWMLQEVYRLRAVVHHEAGRPDSALHCVQQALHAMPRNVEPSFPLLLEINRLSYDFACYPDSIPFRLDACRRLLQDTAQLTPEYKAELLACYGNALLHTPEGELEGISCLERSYNDYLSGGFPQGVVQTGGVLLEACARRGLAERVAAVYPVYTAMRDSLQRAQAVRAAIGANVRYETARKELENRSLRISVELEREKRMRAWMWAGGVVLLLVGVAWIVYQRHWCQWQISEARLGELSMLVYVQSKRARELEQENLDMQRDHGLNELLKTLKEACKKMNEKDKPANSKGIAELREGFCTLCPSYLPALHRRAPGLTSTDEVIAILLYLGMKNDDIAFMLGITRLGVNKARSRLRQRLGLEGKVNLVEYLQKVG